tara:strand:- start:3 stop:1064 length:1062 start_codon:yes stop_codon:yes gene_type:complete
MYRKDGALPMKSPMKNINNMKAYSKPGDAVQFGDAPTDMKSPNEMKSSGFKMKSGSPMKRNFGTGASPVKVVGTHKTYLNPDGTVKNTAQVKSSTGGTKPEYLKDGVEGELSTGGVLGSGQGPDGNYTKKIMVDGLDAMRVVLNNPNSTSEEKEDARNDYSRWRATVGEEYADKDEEIQALLDSGTNPYQLPDELQEFYDTKIKPNVIKGAEEGTSNVVPSDPNSDKTERTINYTGNIDDKKTNFESTVDGTQNLYQNVVRNPTNYDPETYSGGGPTEYGPNDQRYNTLEDIGQENVQGEGYASMVNTTKDRIAELEKGFSEGVTFPNDAKKELKTLKENLAKLEKQNALRDE